MAQPGRWLRLTRPRFSGNCASLEPHVMESWFPQGFLGSSRKLKIFGNLKTQADVAQPGTASALRADSRKGISVQIRASAFLSNPSRGVLLFYHKNLRTLRNILRVFKLPFAFRVYCIQFLSSFYLIV